MPQFFGVAGLTFVAACAGISFVVQQAVNAELRASLGSAAWAGFISYLGGTLCMLAFACVMGDRVPPAAAALRSQWWAWTGGLFGAIYIAISIFLVPRLGTATFAASLLAGQMLSSLTLDHFGLLGVHQHPLDLSRLIGVALLVGGVILIRG